LLGEFYLNAKEGAYLANAVKTNSAPFTHEKRKCKQGDRKGKYTKRKDTEGRVPLSVEFICKAGTWHIHVAYEMPKIPVDFVENYAGVDLNVPSLAAGAYTPKDGLLWSKTFTFDPKATKKEKQRLFHQYVNEVVDWARQNHFGIALEYLEFEHAKRWLKTKLGSLLRIFPYRKLRQIFERRCAKMGVPLRYVNPRYTSLLGNVLGTEHPQLTRDTAAGCIIGLQATDAGNAFLNQKLKQFMLHAKKIRITAKNQFSQHVDCRAITSCQSNKALIALRKQGGLQHHVGRFIKQCQDALAGPERKLRHRGRKIAMSVHPGAAGEPIAHLLVRYNEG
jgi:IS605 OrfB family transposase